MNWPRTPFDRLRDFRPPFCPRQNCSHHIRPDGFRYRSHGSYPTRRGLFVRRFRCLHCLSSFSQRAFCVAYHLNRPELLRPVAAGLQAGSAHRQLARVLPLRPADRPLHLVGDGHPAYDRAIFPVDLLHGLLRHSLAARRRETIAFGRRLKAIVERLFLTAVWRNFVKGVSERRSDRTTPAMRLRLTDRPWKWERVPGRRLFPDRERLDGVWLELYRREWTTPELASNTRHQPVFVY